jgi:predicted dehydrogenase
MTDPSAAFPRRRFLQTTAASAAAATLASAPFVHAQGSDILRVGLIGCGGRGTGAAEQALRADANVKLVAVGDAFRDRVESCLTTLRRRNGDRVDVPADRQFVGLDAYRRVIAAGVDVVLLTSPPGFRPQHIRAAVDADKHIFAEKPVAVDGPGVRSVLAACEDARRKRLAVVSGLCWRYDTPKRETFRRIHDGAIGDIVAMQCNYLTGTLWHRARTADMSDMEWQIRNWLYFTWLSGDFNVEQHVHSLDKLAWAMRDVYPVRCYGLGGRQVRTGPEFGHIFDHMSVVYEWANGVKGFAHCRQQAGCYNEVNDFMIGTRGRVNVMQHTITGENAWRYPAARGRQDVDMYQQEHNELFASIRRGEPINNGEYMCKSTLLGIMGRMACYSGREVTWDQALNSEVRLAPDRLEFDTPVPVPEVARPGITRAG